MKCQVIIIFCCVANLPKIVPLPRTKLQLEEDVMEYADHGATIDDVLEPITAYWGYYSNDGGATRKKVSIHVRSDIGAHVLLMEAMLSLNAAYNPDVELYGIPNIYYLGEYLDGRIIAYSYADDDHSETTEVMDILLKMKYYIRATKYIHSHGLIIPRDVKPEIGFDGTKFLLLSAPDAEQSRNETESFFAYRDVWRYHLNEIPSFKSECLSNGLEDFLKKISGFNLCRSLPTERNNNFRKKQSDSDVDCGLNLSTQHEITFNLLKGMILGVRQFKKSLRSMENKQLEMVRGEFFKESVLMQFQRYPSMANDYPNYDRMDDIINEVLLELDKPIAFSWATDEEKVIAEEKFNRFKAGENNEFPLDGIDIWSIILE